MPLLLVRHARAGERDEWEGDDRDRPLDDRGLAQARTLVETLAPFAVEAILTSPYLRCVQTVEPLAAARGLVPELRPELGEERQATDGAALVRACSGRDVVVCGHGGLDAIIPSAPPWKKGRTFVLDEQLALLEVL